MNNKCREGWRGWTGISNAVTQTCTEGRLPVFAACGDTCTERQHCIWMYATQKVGGRKEQSQSEDEDRSSTVARVERGSKSTRE